MSEKLISPVGVIVLSSDTVINIGSSYRSDIFYQFHNSIPENLGVLYRKEGAVGPELIYSEKGKEPITLLYGEDLTIAGLWLMFLGNYLLVCAREGDLRVAVRERRA